MIDPFVILLTACINPNGMGNTLLADSEERKKQYYSALDYYLVKTNYKIVFVENTGVDISVDYDIYIKTKRLEVLFFQGNEYDKNRGKGYGEALIIDYALRNSLFINMNSLIIKISGRYIIKNINEIVSHAKVKNTVYSLLLPHKKFSYSFFFISPYCFLKNFFLPYSENIDDSKQRIFEKVLFLSIIDWCKKRNKYSSFYQMLQVCACSGTVNKPVTLSELTGMKYQFKKYIGIALFYYKVVF